MSNLASELSSLLYLLQMITAWIVKSSSVLKHYWLTIFILAFWFWAGY